MLCLIRALHILSCNHFLSKLMVTPSSLGLDLYVATPSSVIIRANSMLKFCEVSFEDDTICVDLIVLDMFDFNVIIGMNCLSEYRAHIVCQEKRVLFSP